MEVEKQSRPRVVQPDSLTYDHGQAVMVAWRLFREAIAHHRYIPRFTSACP